MASKSGTATPIKRPSSTTSTPSRTPPPSLVAQKSNRAVPATTLSNASSSSKSKSGTNVSDKDDPFLKLDKKVRAINSNNISRVANSHLTGVEAATARLQPLVSLKTGRGIERFPTTGKEILRLSERDLDYILTQLEADRSGNEKDKQARLRMQIGLKPVLD